MATVDKAAEVIQVIRTDLTNRGDGSKENPYRYVTQFWSLTGELLAEVDPALPRPHRGGPDG